MTISYSYYIDHQGINIVGWGNSETFGFQTNLVKAIIRGKEIQALDKIDLFVDFLSPSSYVYKQN